MEQLTKKEKNRIKSALNQSELEIFDTNEKITSQEKTENLLNSMNRCTIGIKDVLDVFLCGKTTDSYYRKLFSTIDSEGIANISKKCSMLEQDKNALKKVSIRTIFGGTERMPFRGLSYLLPALNLCEQLKKVNEEGELPNIEFLFMNGAGIMANAIDPYRTTETTSKFIDFSKRYIEEYHPILKDKVDFFVDVNFSSNIANTKEYKQIHEILEKKLGFEKDLKNNLLDMGKKRNASMNSIKYAALHAFSQDGDIDSKIAQMSNFSRNQMQSDSDIIISIGAKPEEKFFKVRKLLAKEVSEIEFFTPKLTAQYIANINVPPYSPLSTGELYLKDVLNNPNLIYEARIVDRKNGEFSAYQVPVQKAVESIISDTEHSESNKDIVEFIQDYTKNKNKIINDK